MNLLYKDLKLRWGAMRKGGGGGVGVGIRDLGIGPLLMILYPAVISAIRPNTYQRADASLA